MVRWSGALHSPINKDHCFFWDTLYMHIIFLRDKKDDKDIRMRPFRCEEKSCRKSYFKLSHLKAHVRVHTGDRPFLCPSDSCGATFARFEDVLNKR